MKDRGVLRCRERSELNVIWKMLLLPKMLLGNKLLSANEMTACLDFFANSPLTRMRRIVLVGKNLEQRSREGRFRIREGLVLRHRTMADCTSWQIICICDEQKMSMLNTDRGIPRMGVPDPEYLTSKAWLEAITEKSQPHSLAACCSKTLRVAVGIVVKSESDELWMITRKNHFLLLSRLFVFYRLKFRTFVERLTMEQTNSQ